METAIQRVRAHLEQFKKSGAHDLMHAINEKPLTATDLEIVLLAAEATHVHKVIEQLESIVDRWRTANERQSKSIGRLVGREGKIRRLVGDITKTPEQKIEAIKEVLG